MRYFRDRTKVWTQNSLIHTTEVVDDIVDNHRHGQFHRAEFCATMPGLKILDHI